VVDDVRAFFAGRLLVASPQIEEETFRRSVVLLLHHDEDGAQGVILNRPIEADIDAVLPGWKDIASSPQTMFQGGPVELNSAIGLVTVPGDEPEPLGVKHLFGGLGLVDLDAPPNLVAPEVAGMRIFAGYAGWSGGQLENEILRGDWYVVDSESRDAFSMAPERLWSDVLLRQNDSLKLVASYARPGGNVTGFTVMSTDLALTKLELLKVDYFGIPEGPVWVREGQSGYLLPNTDVQINFYNGRAIGVELPPNVVLTVVDTEPGIKNSTATNSFKPAKMETGITVQVPPFINTGEKIKIDTAEGTYMERA